MRNPFRRGVRGRPFRPAPEREVDAELAFHLEQRVRDYEARGMEPEAARAAALERLGDLTGVRSECTELLAEDRRAEARRDWFDDLRQDVRFGVRGALRAPLFSLLAVVTLALGIGANAAVFGVLKSVLLDALPYADADRLVRVYTKAKVGGSDRGPLSAGMVVDLAREVKSFASTGVFVALPQEIAYNADEGPRPMLAAFAGPGFFRTLGVEAQVGRTLRDDDAGPGRVPIVMLTHAAWQRHFGGDPSVVGRTIRLDGTGVEVAGVLPRDFTSPMGDVDVWVALDLSGRLADPTRARRSQWLAFVARLAPGATLEQARQELATVGAELGRRYPDADGLSTLRAFSLHEDMAGKTRSPLLLLMGSAGLVLLITCANLAGALLSRTLSRRKEFAVRVALGAGRGRLVRQLLTESTLLALVGGVAGIALAAAGLGVLRTLAPKALPPYAALSLDPVAVAVTFALALATGIAFGLVPALSAGKADVQGTLRDETRGATGGPGAGRLRGLLVAGQIAMCVSLLAGAGLLGRSLWEMATAPLGFDPEGVLTVTVRLPGGAYNSTGKRDRFLRDFEARLRTIPGVREAAVAGDLPGTMLSRNGLAIDGKPWASPDQMPFILYAPVSPSYFRTMRIPLLRGRSFADGDGPDAPQVVVINESMAKRFWPDGDAVGARIRMGPDPNEPPFEVIGVVADVRNDPTLVVQEPITYVTTRQQPWLAQVFTLVRVDAEPMSFARAVQRELSAIDPMLPVHEVSTMRARVESGLTGRGVPALLVAAFGVLALLLASVGVYAMFASMAASREREFGVRVALGSSRRQIATLVLRQGGAWMAAGLVLGAAGVVMVTSLLRGLLFEVSRFDPLALGIALAVLVACAAIALLAPVRRATRVDPISVLR